MSVGITTRNRHASLERCLESLRHISHLDPEILVFDDGSDPPVSAALGGRPAVRIIRDASAPGNIVGRNRLMAAASADAVLLLDDDAALVDSEAVERGLSILEADGGVAAVGFAQANADGTPWPESMQAGPGQSPRYVAAFIGFAHLLRRRVFLDLGGYRERFVFYGEEKEFCLRLLDRGFHVVYLPEARVLHLQDPSGRSRQRYLRYVTRNDMLHAIYNEPAHRAAWLLPARLGLYFRMRQRWGISDPGGWWWVVREVTRNARAALADRRPVSRRTLGEWRRLRHEAVPYSPPTRPRRERSVV